MKPLSTMLKLTKQLKIQTTSQVLHVTCKNPACYRRDRVV